MIETNLAANKDFDWLEKMKHEGYTIQMDFFSTGDVEINKERVHRRVTEGGHDVPDAIIEHRYQMSTTYLKSKIFIFNEVRFIDTSSWDIELVASTESGRIVNARSNCPEWATDILSIAKRLEEKGQ